MPRRAVCCLWGHQRAADSDGDVRGVSEAASPLSSAGSPLSCPALSTVQTSARQITRPPDLQGRSGRVPPGHVQSRRGRSRAEALFQCDLSFVTARLLYSGWLFVIVHPMQKIVPLLVKQTSSPSIASALPKYYS